MSTRRATLARAIVPGALVLVLVLAGCSSPSSSVGLESDAGGASDTVSVLSDGSKGPQGAPGADGKPGIQGPIGLRGAPGPAGPQGIQGPRGPVGPAGANGQNGASGLPAVAVVKFEPDEVTECYDDGQDTDDSLRMTACPALGEVTLSAGPWLVSAKVGFQTSGENPFLVCQLWSTTKGMLGEDGFRFTLNGDSVFSQGDIGYQIALQADAGERIQVRCADVEIQGSDEAALSIVGTLTALQLSSIDDQSPTDP